MCEAEVHADRLMRMVDSKDVLQIKLLEILSTEWDQYERFSQR